LDVINVVFKDACNYSETNDRAATADFKRVFYGRLGICSRARDRVSCPWFGSTFGRANEARTVDLGSVAAGRQDPAQRML
jgi:hypothetical protein